MTQNTAWYVSRAAGLVAYTLLWLSVLWGILVTSKPFGRGVSKPALLDFHRVFVVAALTFVAFHSGVLLFDNYINYGWLDILVPLHTGYRTLATGLGIVAFELGFVVAISIKFKKVMGKRAWHALHFASYPVYAMALLHFILMGTEAKNRVVLLLAIGSGLLVVFATAFRVIYHEPAASQARVDVDRVRGNERMQNWMPAPTRPVPAFAPTGAVGPVAEDPTYVPAPAQTVPAPPPPALAPSTPAHATPQAPPKQLSPELAARLERVRASRAARRPDHARRDSTQRV